MEMMQCLFTRLLADGPKKSQQVNDLMAVV
jgi:hypothetical protein